METKFYRCPICGNVIVKVADSGVMPVCCGHEMQELVANTSEGMGEKHLPVVTRQNDYSYHVQIGAQLHPMEEAHYILFICLETQHGFQLHYLKPGDKPQTDFCCCKSQALSAYAYCNKHGLWKTEITSRQNTTKPAEAPSGSCSRQPSGFSSCCGMVGDDKYYPCD